MDKTDKTKIEAFRIVVYYFPKLWREFSTLNKQYSIVFSFKEYEKTFQVIKKSRYGIKYELDGRCHRSDGPAIICINGDEYWYRHGINHRVGGPAIDTCLLKVWMIKGLRHRLDGPAYYCAVKVNNTDLDAFYINGKSITQEKFERRVNFYKKIGIYDKMLKHTIPDLISLPF